MKKLFTALLFTLLVLGFTTSVFAKSPTTISEDLQTITYKDETFIRLDCMMYLADYKDLNEKFSFTQSQEDALENVELKLDASEKLLYARIRHKDGTIDAAQFLSEQYIDMYQSIQNDELKTYLIDFRSPKGNVLPVDMTHSLGAYITLTGEEIDYCDSFLVYAKSDDGEMTAVTGAVIINGYNYYYLDFNDMKLDLREDFQPWNYEALSMREITKSDIIDQLRSSYNSFWDDNSTSYDDSLNIDTIKQSAFSDHTVSDYATRPPAGFVFTLVMIILLFGVAPLAALVCSIIVGIKSTGTYKTIFKVVGALSIVELVIFVILLIVLI